MSQSFLVEITMITSPPPEVNPDIDNIVCTCNAIGVPTNDHHVASRHKSMGSPAAFLPPQVAMSLLLLMFDDRSQL